MRGNQITDRSGNKNPNFKHGLKNSRLYRIYHNMMTRCYNGHCKNFNRYGGRGITICDEWRNDFQAFYDWSMAHGYSEELSIDRINNNGNYEPDNCRWITPKGQSNNTSHCKFITIDGETKSLMEWCEITGTNYSTARDRINRGHWDPISAVTVPSDKRFRKKVK